VPDLEGAKAENLLIVLDRLVNIPHDDSDLAEARRRKDLLLRFRVVLAHLSFPFPQSSSYSSIEQNLPKENPGSKIYTKSLLMNPIVGAIRESPLEGWG
jgi:hypothetical protein